MKFADLYSGAILWTCWLENYPNQSVFLNVYGLNEDERLLFDSLGRFFPFNEFYCRIGCDNVRAIDDLRLSAKNYILPWIYRPVSSQNSLLKKNIICPSPDMFDSLDNKVEAKKLMRKLGIPTPEWAFVSKGTIMLEKPIQNSSLGLGIRLTYDDARKDYYLEEYLPGRRSIGLQFFVYDEIEFICANEMLYHAGEERGFTFHSQINTGEDKLPKLLLADCLKLIEYLQGNGYRGLINIDALAGEESHYFLEINPRGSAFLPVFFAASSAGWTEFITHMKEGNAESGEMVLLDFGRLKKVVRRTH